MTETLPGGEPSPINDAGWGWPGLSKKAHYFLAGDMTALCGRWAFTGRRENNNHTSKDNCAECKRRLAKRLARGTA